MESNLKFSVSPAQTPQGGTPVSKLEARGPREEILVSETYRLVSQLTLPLMCIISGIG